MKKYRTYDPATGRGTEHNTKADAIATFLEQLIALGNNYWHGVPYTVCDYKDDGTCEMYVEGPTIQTLLEPVYLEQTRN